MRVWHFPDVRPAGLGPWAGEPDKAQWIDDRTDFDCLMVRNHMGAWCGYVGLPPGHPWHGVGYGEVDDRVYVHGGLTFSAFCQDGPEDGPVVCHVPGPGRPADVWWLGFDCAHTGYDLVPGMEVLSVELGLPSLGGEYRTFSYVRDAVEHLAAQIAAITTGVGYEVWRDA